MPTEQPSKPCRHSDGKFAEQSFDAIYAEIKRLDDALRAEKSRLAELRAADQLAVTAALSAAEKAVAAALVASEKAVNKAEVAQANINVNQNEFRGQLKDQAATLMPRNEAENTTRELRGLIGGVAAETTALRSRIDIGPPSLGLLQARSDNEAGRARGTTATWAIVVVIITLILSGIGGLLGVIGIIINLM